MIVWLATRYDKFDDGQGWGWGAAATTAERSKALCEQHYADDVADDPDALPLGAWKQAPPPTRFHGLSRWTADVPAPDHGWYDVIELKVDPA